MNIDECVARIEIQNLLAAWSIGCDQGEFPEWVWAEDAVVHAPGGVRLAGRDNIIGRFTGRRYTFTTRDSDEPVTTEAPPIPVVKLSNTQEPTWRRHNLTTSLITFEGAEAARGVTYALILSEEGLTGSALYEDRFRKLPPGWRFVERRTRLEYVHPNEKLDAIRAIARGDRAEDAASR